MKKIIFLSLAIILAIGLALAGCGGTTVTTTAAGTTVTTTAPGTTATTTAVKTTATTVTTTATAARTSILVGVIDSLTGGDAMVGVEYEWALRKAVSDINDAGGVMVKDLNKKLPLELTFVDDKSSPTEASAAAEKLIKIQNVDFLMGSTTTPYNEAAGVVADKYKKFYICTTFWPEAFLNDNFSYVADVFFYAGKLGESALKILDPIPQADRPKNFCVMVMDNPDGQAFGGGAKENVTKYGYNLALYEPYIEGGKDYSASILRMKSNNVDGMIYLGSSADGITLIRQIKEANYNLKYIWGAKGFWPAEFGLTLGADSDYIVSDAHWEEAAGYPGAKDLGDVYVQQFGHPSVTVGSFYSLVQALANGIETAGTLDSTAVKDVFYSGTFTVKGTTNGDLAFNNQGYAEIPPVGLQWYKGQREPAYPPLPDIWTVKLIPPWNQR
jgi:ABC-type branched-subunit amino acid transport system substrate-binding protein